MTTLMHTNGRAERKSLASQLDRLDTILDALSEGLNEAVAGAVQDAVGRAVETAIKEVFGNPEVLRVLRAQAAPTPTPRPHASALKDALRRAYQRTRSAVSRAWTWVTGKIAAVAGAVRTRTGKIVTLIGTAGTTLTLCRPLLCRSRTALTIASAIGVAIGAACFWSGPLVAATVCGVAGFTGSLTINAVTALRRASTTVDGFLA